MRIRRFFAAIAVAGALLPLGMGSPADAATRYRTVAGDFTFGAGESLTVTATDIRGYLGSAAYQAAPDAGPVDIDFRCVNISWRIPIGLRERYVQDHFLRAWGEGSDGQRYYVTVAVRDVYTSGTGRLQGARVTTVEDTRFQAICGANADNLQWNINGGFVAFVP